VSFRKKHREARETEAAEGEDVKIAHEKKGSKSGDDSGSGDQSSQQQQAAEQTTGQQSGQETGQPPDQGSDETSDDEEEDDKSDDEPVPDGTTAEILRWVGSDRDRAQRALDKEQGDDRPRTGLTGELKRILGE
jgi:hypothetical protein